MRQASLFLGGTLCVGFRLSYRNCSVTINEAHCIDVESCHELRVFDRTLTCLARPDAVALPLHCWRPGDLEAGLAELAPQQSAFLRATGFAAAKGQVTLLPGPEGLAGAAVGLGSDRSPYAHGHLPMSLPAGTAWRLEPGDFSMEAAVLGFCLGAYQFTSLKTPKH
jgi:hypothetical protein